MVEAKETIECRCCWLLAYVSASNPRKTLAGENPFQLDSKAPTADYRAFIEGEVRYSSLKRSFPDKADQLFDVLLGSQRTSTSI